MNVKEYDRNPTRIKDILKNKDGAVYVTEDVIVTIPKRYMDKGLLQIDEHVNSVGIFPILTTDKQYGILTITADISLTPDDIEYVKIDGVEYLSLSFLKDSMFIADKDVVVSDSHIDAIFDLFMSQGFIPWFLGYEDLIRIYDSAYKYSGSKIGDNSVGMEVIVSAVARNPSDRKKYYRYDVADRSDLKKNPPTFVALKSIFYSTSNTTSKIIGSYFGDGVVSALTDKSETTERIESLLRQ